MLKPEKKSSPLRQRSDHTTKIIKGDHALLLSLKVDLPSGLLVK
jgi:hypothetical protein